MILKKKTSFKTKWKAYIYNIQISCNFANILRCTLNVKTLLKKHTLQEPKNQEIPLAFIFQKFAFINNESKTNLIAQNMTCQHHISAIWIYLQILTMPMFVDIDLTQILLLAFMIFQCKSPLKYFKQTAKWRSTDADIGLFYSLSACLTVFL